MNYLNIEFKKHDYLAMFFVVISALIYSVNMNTFVSSANLFPAGFSGIARLSSELIYSIFNFRISFSVFFFLMNISITFFVFTKLGRKFAIFSIIWFTFTTIFTAVLPKFMITDDFLLNSVFGGIINGFAIGIALKNNASSGGTDFIAIYMSIKKNMPMWNYMMGLNAVILIIAGISFGWEKSLYSIIYQYASTQVINSMHNRYKLSNLFIVTEKSDEVAQAFYKTCRHGITKINVEGEHSHKPKIMLFTTINSYQLPAVINAVKNADPKVFITVNRSEKIVGNYYQKPLE